jgi:hypothetical protein
MSISTRHLTWYDGKRCRVQLDIGPISVNLMWLINTTTTTTLITAYSSSVCVWNAAVKLLLFVLCTCWGRGVALIPASGRLNKWRARSSSGPLYVPYRFIVLPKTLFRTVLPLGIIITTCGIKKVLLNKPRCSCFTLPCSGRTGLTL